MAEFDVFHGLVAHVHKAKEVKMASGQTVEDAINQGIIPDTWKDSNGEVRAIDTYEDKDDVGLSTNMYVFKYTAASGANDDDNSILRPTNIVPTFTVSGANPSIVADLGGMPITCTGTSAVTLAADIGTQTGGVLVGTAVGDVVTINHSIPNSYFNCSINADVTLNTPTGRWVRQFILVDTTLAQTISNKLLDNTNIFINGSANGYVKLTNGVMGAPPFTKVITIGATNCDYTAIQTALTANAVGGEVFLVFPGTYTGANNTINFTANSQTVVGFGEDLYNVQIVHTDRSAFNVGAFGNCTVKNICLSHRVTGATLYNSIECNDGTTTFENCLISIEVRNTSTIATPQQPALTYISAAGEVYFKDCLLTYTNANDGGTYIKVPFYMYKDGYIKCQNCTINVSSTNATSATGLAYHGGNSGLYGELNIENCNIDVYDVAATYICGNSYIVAGTPVDEFKNNTINVSRAAGGAPDVAAFYASGAGAARVTSYRNNISVTNNDDSTHEYSYFQAGTPTITIYDDNIECARGGESGTIIRMATTHALINHVAGQYFYEAANIIGDTIGDRRIINTAGVYTIERCTVAHAVKGSGTWATDVSLDNLGGFTAGFYINIVGTRTANTTFTFAGTENCTYKYLESLFTSRSAAAVIGTGGDGKIDNDGGNALITLTAHARLDGDVVYLGGTLTSTNFIANTPYFVKVKDVNSYYLCTSLANVIATTYIAYGADGTSVTAANLHYGWISALSHTAGTCTATVISSEALVAGESNFRISTYLKADRFVKEIRTGMPEIVGDASNSQGMYYNDTKQHCYILPTDLSVRTAATDPAAAVQVVLYADTTAMNSVTAGTVWDLDINTELLSQRTDLVRWLKQGENFTMRVISSAGATKAAGLQVRCTIIPIGRFLNA